jgi:hypothetical protein
MAVGDGLEAVPDDLAHVVQDIRGHVRAEAPLVAAADGEHPGALPGTDRDQGRGLHLGPEVAEKKLALVRVQGAAQAVPAVEEVVEGVKQGIGLLAWCRQGEELEGDALGVEVAAHGLVQDLLQPVLIRCGDQGQGQPVKAGRKGLVLTGAGDDVGHPATLVLELAAQDANLVLDQRDGLPAGVGDAQLGDQVLVTLEEATIGPEEGRDRLVRPCRFGRTGLVPSRPQALRGCDGVRRGEWRCQLARSGVLGGLSGF